VNGISQPFFMKGALRLIERSWHRVAAATALIGAAVLAALVTVPPDLAKTAWKTEWIARVGIGLGSFFIAIAVIGTTHWVIVKGVPPPQVGLQPFSVGLRVLTAPTWEIGSNDSNPSISGSTESSRTWRIS
jgi:hypothetical protein